MAAMRQTGGAWHVFAQRGTSRGCLNPGLAHTRTVQSRLAPPATTERFAISGRLKDASIHAKRAVGRLPRGSTEWRRADGIPRAAETQEKRKKRK